MFFEKGIYERPFTLERQQCTPTRNRIQNTPKVGSSDDWVQTNQRTDRITCGRFAQSASVAMRQDYSTQFLSVVVNMKSSGVRE